MYNSKDFFKKSLFEKSYLLLQATPNITVNRRLDENMQKIIKTQLK